MQGTGNCSRRFEENTSPMVRPEQQLRGFSRGLMEKSLSGRISLRISRHATRSPNTNILESPLGKSRHGRGVAHHKPNPHGSKEDVVLPKLSIEEVLSKPLLTTKLTEQELNQGTASLTKRLSSRTATSTSATTPISLLEESPTKSASHSSNDDDSTTEVIDEHLEQAYIEMEKQVSEGPTFKPPEYILVPDFDNWRVEL